MSTRTKYRERAYGEDGGEGARYYSADELEEMGESILEDDTIHRLSEKPTYQRGDLVWGKRMRWEAPTAGFLNGGKAITVFEKLTIVGRYKSSWMFECADEEGRVVYEDASTLIRRSR